AVALEAPQLVEDVRRANLRLGRGAVELQILAGAGDRLGRGLDADGPPRAATERVAGEAGGVAEGVEHVPIPGQRADPRPILPLVEVEAGLVADADRHLEGGAAFGDPYGPRPGAPGPAEGGRKALQLSRVRLVGPGEDPAAEGGLGIVKAAPDEPTARVDHRDRRAGLDVAGVGHVGLEDPGMGARGVVPPLEPKRRLAALHRQNASAVIAQR